MSKFQKLNELFTLVPLNGKVPCEKNWQRYCSEPRDYDDAEFSGKNAGIPTGPYNNILVLDVDDNNTFTNFLDHNGYDMPDTYTVITGGGGYHYYYKYPDDGNEYGNRSKKKYGFDIRGIGGIVVAPYSVHPDTGNIYKIVNDMSIQEAPLWLRKLSQKTIHQSTIDNNSKNVEIDKLQISDKIKYIIIHGAPTGQRSEEMFKTYKALLSAGYDRNTITGIMKKYAIGEKYREKKSGDKWLADEITRAELDLNNTTSNYNILTEFNSKYAVIKMNNSVYILEEVINQNGQIEMKFLRKRDLEIYHFNEFVEKKNAKPQNAFSWWMRHPDRRTYENVTFIPGDEVPKGTYNMWKGFTVKPVEGDCSRFLEHTREVICNNNDHNYEYVMAWLANIIQDTQNKPGTALVLSGGQGTGKSIWVEYFSKLIKSHFLQVTSQKHLSGNFNAHMLNKILIFSDEAYWAGDKSAEGRLKALVTEEKLFIEMKGKDGFLQDNFLRIIMATNNDWAVPAGIDERRFCILSVSEIHKQDTEYFKSLVDEMNTHGPAALLHVLLNHQYQHVDLRKIPRTKGLLYHKLKTLPLVPQFWYDCLDEGVLLSDHDEWRNQITVDEFYNAFLEWAQKLGQYRRETKVEFGKHMNEVCKELDKKNLTIGGDFMYGYNSKIRKNHYIFPPLSRCRELFNSYINEDILWDDNTPDSQPFDFGGI